MPRSLVLVLGATGSFGSAFARELLQRGCPVRVLARYPEKIPVRLGRVDGFEIVHGDVQDAETLARAADGCAAIVHAVNYPYPQWIPHLETATANVLAAAKRSGATILFPGNVYGLGRQIGRSLPETAGNFPCSKKGALRVRLERALEAAAITDRVRAIVLRAGDYFGPTVRNGLVDPIFGNAARGNPIRALGRLDIPHQWAYVPDLARLGVLLLEKADLMAPFEVVHFHGYVARPQGTFLRLVARQAGHPDLPIKAASWWLVRLAGLVDGVARELWEIRYLFDEDVIIDDARRRQLMPDFKATPIEEAVRTTIESYRADG